jgi:purine-nucleoside phosphorylase
VSASQTERVAAALASVRERAGPPAPTAFVLGSGLGHLADAVADAVVIPYGEIAGFPAATAPSHAGRLVVGSLHGARVAIAQGRFHLYEGHPARDVALPVYLLRALGAERLIVTNAAGALNASFEPGQVMLIDDHINLTGANPLTGPEEPALGLRFPDMSRAYDPLLRAAALEAAEAAGVTLRRGIYVGIAGPSLETSAERRFFASAGGDAIGMSTVTEVIAANHAGMAVLGLSAITNAATGGPDQAPDSIEEVLANAARAGEKIARLLARLLSEGAR